MEFGDLAIMVVEDNANIRAIVRTILKSIGVRELHEYEDADAALEHLRTGLADILIVDWQMEPVSGYLLVHDLRTDEDHPKRMMPVIMITAHTRRKYVQDARDVGVDEFVAKPLSPKGLIERLVKVATQARPFVVSDNYCGPDRRRQAKPVENERRVQETVCVERPPIGVH